MKNIANKLRFVLLLGFLTISIAAWSQIANVEKMSMSTQMFLDEMAGKINFDEPVTSTKGGKPELIPIRKPSSRPIATPDTIDGKVYISAFVQVTDENDISALESLGVLIMCQFQNGLMTANIPIDKIEEVAAINGVIYIEVGELMEEDTDLSRQATNVDDILTLSNDAQLANLKKKYDGSGVVLGIIDSGVDFDHIAFKDKNGNNRIKRAYAYNGSTATDWTGSGSFPNDGVTNSDHGTHTSSIAGGSSVIINGTDVTVTDDHANATYGGMAPGADLFLAGVNGLNSTYCSNAFQKMCDYADSQGQPLVVSNSWSNTYGPRDGQYGGGAEQVVAQLFGESHPNRICLFAASNRAGNAIESEGGGLYATGTSTSSNPFGSLLRYKYYSNADGGYYYNTTILDAWARNTSVSLACKLYVIDSSTGAILTTITLSPGSSSTTVSGLSDYYDGTLTAYWATNSYSGKKQFRLYTNGLETKSYTHDSENNYYYSSYSLAVEVYPTSGSTIIDMWAGTGGYFTNYLTTSGHNWALGSDDISVSDHAIMPEVISVGSYVTRERSSGNSQGDISKFSGYAIEGVGPLGTMQPWITAPGEVIISAYNHLRTGRTSDPLVNNPNYPYGTSQGTSMATPCAAGIVALWLQAATECDKQLKLSDVKNIMAETAIRDSWVTSGPNASHFGNGKIDALAGIEYILRQYGGRVSEIICDETATNAYVPVYGNYYRYPQTNQMLYPASKFTDKGMDGKTIKTITFYPSNGINYRGGTVTIKLANMPSGTGGYTYNNPAHKDADFTTVKTFSMPSTAQAYKIEWVIDDLTDNFTYEGGDLLIEVTTTAGTNGATSFYGEEQPQQSYPSYYSYVRSGATTSRGLRFLPKVKFTWDESVEPIAGTVSPDELTFTDVPIGRSQNGSVTITNTGNQTFTPVIDTTNLPVEFTVTGNGEVLTNGTLNLTVTYSPTDEGPHSGSFTITIGDQTYIVTVSGNGIVVSSTLTSNTVMVPVYKTDVEVLTAYTLEQLEEDVNHQLQENVTNTDVNIKVQRNDAITRYDVYHKAGVKESQSNWAAGEDFVAYTTNNSTSYIPYAKDEDDLTSWVQQPAVGFSGENNEMWVHLNDYVEVHDANTWYVPVVVADGVVTTGNTYGAPIRPSYMGSMTAVVNYDQSTTRVDADNNNAEYYYMTAEVVLHCIAPQVEEGANYHYECYKARAWRRWTPYVVGVGAGEVTETLMGEADLDGSEDEVIIGCKDFQMVNGQWSLDEPVFCSPVGTVPLFISRFYYKRVANSTSLMDGGGGGGGGGGAGAPGDGPAPPGNRTGLNEFTVDKVVAGVTYVNALGMTSSEPFEGVNIIVTRYTDGSMSTRKMIKH